MSSTRRLLPLAALGLTLVLGPWSLVIPARAQSAPRATATAPIVNFRLPTFTPEGHRQLMIRAGEARVPDPARIDAVELEVTVFTGKADENIESLLAAASASFFPEKLFVTGADTVRLERRDLTITGAAWSYDHQARVVTIGRDAHLIFRALVGDILK